MPNLKSSVSEPASLTRTLPRFDAEFIERRFQEHRAQMAEYAAELASDISCEVAAGVKAARVPNLAARELNRKRLTAKRKAA